MNNLWKDIGLGLRTYGQSFGFISRNGLWYYYLYPLVFIILFSIGATAGISGLNDYFTPMIYDLLALEEVPGDGWWEVTLNFLKNAGQYLISFVIWLGLVFIYYKISKYLVLICMSPIMALISEKTDEILTGRTVPFNFGQFIKDVWRGVLIALRNMILEIGIIIGLALINLLVGLVFAPFAVITTPLFGIITFLVGAYYYGFSTMDYSSERQKLSVRQSIRFIRKYKGIALANGTIFTLWLIVPILGTYIGTIFAPVTCTVGATLAIHERTQGDLLAAVNEDGASKPPVVVSPGSSPTE